MCYKAQLGLAVKWIKEFINKAYFKEMLRGWRVGSLVKFKHFLFLRGLELVC